MSLLQSTRLQETIHRIEPQDPASRAAARAHLERLTMPHWALGRLMDLAVDLAGMTRSLRPCVTRRAVVVMAGDHGVASEGVSSFPSEVTPQMVRNFVRGGAGINALAAVSHARVIVVDAGVAVDLDDLVREGLIVSKKVAYGTCSLLRGRAMTAEQAIRSVEAGIEVAHAMAPTVDLFGTGDMGIGNTTPSSAIISVMAQVDPAVVTGRGTGVDDAGLKRKIEVIGQALALNRPDPGDGLDVLSKVGGFEIGAIAGLILGCASMRRPVLVDGIISTAGALIAYSLAPSSRDYMIAAHRGAEPGHRIALEHIGLSPLLELGLRLGEGTGAALAMGLVEGAARLLTDVATFDEAAVSKAIP